jgi:hypothetical protein
MHPEAIGKLESSFNLVWLAIADIRNITAQDIANILTLENKTISQEYLQLANSGKNEKWYIRDLIDTFRMHEWMPITNAFMLHELLESKLISKFNIDISQSQIPMELHFQSVLFHTYYLYLLSKEAWLDISYSEVLAYDPLSCWIDKGGIKNIYQLQNQKLDSSHDLFKYFKNILSKEFWYSVFWESPLWNGYFYESN